MNHRDVSINRFLDFVAAEEVTPAAGSVTAMVGAGGAALVEMVCHHSRSTERPAAVLEQLEETGEGLRMVRERLLDLSEADANAVDALLDVNQTHRNDSPEAKRATGVPLAIAEAGLDVLNAAPFVLKHGNRNAVPDGITGVLLTHVTIQASIYLVRTNLEFIDDSTFRQEMDERATEVESSAEEIYRSLLETEDLPVE